MSPQHKKQAGYIHSIESMGTLDGPGLRTVVFFQGCPLRCKFCHNIDSVLPKKGRFVSVEDLSKEVLKNKAYWISYNKPVCNNDICVHGGVTVSGGDPVFQPDFLKEFLLSLKEENVHTAIDSSLVTTPNILETVFPYVDLWMVSLKHMDDEQHKNLTGSSNKLVHKNLLKLDKIISDSPNRLVHIRIRFLIVPGLTDSEDNIRQTGEFAKKLKNLEGIELLAYGSHGKYKWMEIFGKYDLDDVRESTDADIKRAREILERMEIPLIEIK